MELRNIILCILFSPALYGQQIISDIQVKDTLASHDIKSKGNTSKVHIVFKNIEDGIKAGSVEKFEKDLGAVVSITIGPAERGYYSMNQAISVLAGFFADCRPVSFEFSRIDEMDPVPYATGRFIYIKKRNRESAQVYMALVPQDSVWVINQLNIY